ncbi:hypothetical protein Agub_g931, partial [Astrephomene gubernaculifera]
MLRPLPSCLRAIGLSNIFNTFSRSGSAQVFSQLSRRRSAALSSCRARSPSFGWNLAQRTTTFPRPQASALPPAALPSSFMPGGLVGSFGRTLVNTLHSWSTPTFAATAHFVQQRLAGMGLLGWLALDLGINWAGWAAAAALKTEVFYDLLGSLSFLTLTGGSLLAGGGAAAGGRQLLASCLVAVWAVRLGSYLAARIARSGRDSRFDGVRDNPARFLVYWTMQAVWVFVTLLPVLLLNGRG